MALAGCGRAHFDVTVDASSDVVPLGHDEDGDGIADSLDVCPHVVTATQDDADGDGVGDACDPNPTVARERLRLYTFVPGDQPFTVDTDGVATPLADAVRFDGLEGPDGNIYMSLAMPVAFGDVRIVVGADILEVRPAPAIMQNQLAMQVIDQLPYTFVEMNQRPQYSRAEVASFDGTTYSTNDASDFAARMHPGPIHLDATLRMGQGITADVGWDNEPYSVMYADGNAYRGATQMNVHANNLYLEVRYVCVIESL
jgi:hypothetical protein